MYLNLTNILIVCSYVLVGLSSFARGLIILSLGPFHDVEVNCTAGPTTKKARVSGQWAKERILSECTCVI